MSEQLWPYVWAMFRLASRGRRRSTQTEHAILELAGKAWADAPPKRRFGYWHGSAWMTSAFLQTLRAVHHAHKNLFAPDGQFATRLQEFAQSEVVKRMRRRPSMLPELIAAEQPDEEFKALHDVARALSYDGVVVLGFGIPKGIFWVGIVDSPRVWQLPEEERALQLFLPARPLPQPQTILTGPPSRSLLPLLIDHTWRKDVVRSLLAADGFEESETGLTRDGRTFGTGHNADEFLLIEPTVAEVERVRLRQLRGEFKPLWVIDRKQIERASWHFPWLWHWGRNHVPDTNVLPAHPRWTDVHTLLLIKSAFVKLDVWDDPEVSAFWAARHATPVDELLRALNEWVPTPGARPELGAGGSGARYLSLGISPESFFAHRTLTALLRDVTDWLLARHDDRKLITTSAQLWREHDPEFAATIVRGQTPRSWNSQSVR
jgi:hypothetical protein